MIDQEQSIKDRILARIESREIEMQPRFLLVLKVAALALVVIVALLISVFLFNFLFFFLRINLYGAPFGLTRFLLFFPWPVLAIDIGLLILAEMLLRQFRFGYRRPVLYTLFALLACTISAGLTIDRITGFNESMEGRAHHGHLPPPLGDMYRHARHF